MKRLLLLGCLIGACGGAQKDASGPADPHLVPDIADDAKLTREQCAEIVDHAFEVFVRSNPGPDAVAAAETERDAQKADESLNQCMQDVNGKFYKCVLTAQNKAAVDACSP